MNGYLLALEKYAVFTGRSTRREYWTFTLVHAVVCVVLVLACTLVLHQSIETGMPLVVWVYALGVAIPGLAVTVRRLHDIGFSGYWVLLGFVPIAGAIALIVLALKDSQVGTNRFGPYPKETRNEDFP